MTTPNARKGDEPVTTHPAPAPLPELVEHDGRLTMLSTATGELVALEHVPAPDLAAAEHQLADRAGEIARARAAIKDELNTRLGALGRTLDTGAHIVEKTVKREWDPDATWDALAAIRDAGLITEADMDRAMPYPPPKRPARKPAGTALNALLTRIIGVNPELGQTLAAARTETASIRVKPAAVDSTAEAA